jgi:photosystem II stability/assembly factor-like uncharacterized protein
MDVKIKINIIVACLACSFFSTAQSIKLLTEGNKFSIRGLSVVNDKTVWVSGSGGMVGKSLDSGNTWKWMLVKGFEKTDFRDIEAFDETTAVIMGIGEPAYILKTGDGGDTWKVVFENKEKGMFLDAMEFWNEQSGIVVGDPVNSKIFIARTFDGGFNWRALPANNYPIADSGEALFASSGTNIRKLNNAEAVFVTGGIKSRLFIKDKKIDLPILQGRETTGANSIAIKNEKIMVIVGGDFSQKDARDKNCFISRDAGLHWFAAATPPNGYRSCVEYIGKNKWICCGLNGVDLSTDDGKNWQWISKESFHVCRKAKDGTAVFLAGNNGKIGKLIKKP